MVPPSMAATSAPTGGVAPFNVAVPINTWGDSCCADTVRGSTDSIATIASRTRILLTYAIDSSFFLHIQEGHGESRRELIGNFQLGMLNSQFSFVAFRGFGVCI